MEPPSWTEVVSVVRTTAAGAVELPWAGDAAAPSLTEPVAATATTPATAPPTSAPTTAAIATIRLGENSATVARSSLDDLARPPAGPVGHHIAACPRRE